MAQNIAIATHDILSAQVCKNGRLGTNKWVGCARTWENGDIELTFEEPLIQGWRVFLRKMEQ